MVDEEAQKRGNRRAKEELDGINQKVTDADEQNAPPPVGCNGRGEEGGDGKEHNTVSDHSSQFAALPLRQRVPLQHIIAHQMGQKHRNNHYTNRCRPATTVDRGFQLPSMIPLSGVARCVSGHSFVVSSR